MEEGKEKEKPLTADYRAVMETSNDALYTKVYILPPSNPL